MKIIYVLPWIYLTLKSTVITDYQLLRNNNKNVMGRELLLRLLVAQDEVH